ncbi:MAG TPA: hypothetical protein VGR03_12455 [Candidatus Acidoferrum sp.]|nr:hypothetical protein [Candidatus Acidoferrum sp.]
MGTDTERKEFNLFARYLIGQEAPDELLPRYVRANSILFREGCDPKETAAVAFVCRHPRTLPYMDAACGLLRPDHLLRKKLLVIMAILETTPALADHFLSRATRGIWPLLAEVAWTGLVASVKGIVGLVLFGRYVVR